VQGAVLTCAAVFAAFVILRHSRPEQRGGRHSIRCRSFPAAVGRQIGAILTHPTRTKHPLG